MKIFDAKITYCEKVATDSFLLGFRSGYIRRLAKPGQFLNILINESLQLRRPLSIHRIKGNTVLVLFRVRGQGTGILSRKKKGETINILGPLGKGFSYSGFDTGIKTDIKTKKGRVWSANNSLHIFLAGGMGAAPLLFAAEHLKKISSPKPRGAFLLGTRTKKEIVCEKEFKKLGFQTFVSTEDGSRGFKGQATDLLRKYLKDNKLGGYSLNIYACGPVQMLKNLKKVPLKNAYIQASLENFMGCGIGACCACTVKTKQGLKKVCKDGPVFNIKDLLF